MGLVLPFYTDAGVIAINDHLFKIVDSRAVDDDEDLPIGDAVAILRFMFQVLDLGVGDAVVRGSAVQALIEDNFPQLHLFLTSPDNPCQNSINIACFWFLFIIMISSLQSFKAYADFKLSANKNVWYENLLLALEAYLY